MLKFNPLRLNDDEFRTIESAIEKLRNPHNTKLEASFTIAEKLENITKRARAAAVTRDIEDVTK